MGITHTKVWVINPSNREQREEVEFLVDSGAVYTVIPEEILQRVGISPVEKRAFIMADGREVTLQLGLAHFTFNGRYGASPVVFGKSPSVILLGAMTLEALGMGLDPLRKQLIPIPLPLM